MHELFNKCRILYQIRGFLFDPSSNYRNHHHVINYMKRNVFLPKDRIFLRSISESNKDNNKSNIIKTSLVKILIDYVQVTSLILDFNFNWPNEIGAFLEAVTKVTPTNKDALSIDCFIALSKILAAKMN